MVDTRSVSDDQGRSRICLCLCDSLYALERDMKRDYEAIGKIVYERFAAAGSLDDAPLQQLCEEIARKEILIDEYQGEIDEKKNAL